MCHFGLSPTNGLKAVEEYKVQNPEIGSITGQTHKILINNLIPFTPSSYPIPIARKQATRQELNRLINLNIIRPSKSNFISVAFPIYKRSNGIRIVVDYRLLNKRTSPLLFPLPRTRVHFAIKRIVNLFTNRLTPRLLPNASSSKLYLIFSVHPRKPSMWIH